MPTGRFDGIDSSEVLSEGFPAEDAGPGQALRIVSNFPIHLDLDEVLRGQGADPERMNLRPVIRELYTEAIVEAAQLIRPAVIYRLCPVREIRHNCIILDGGRALHSHLVADLLSRSEEAALAVCTIGSQLEQRVSAYFEERQATKAVILDAVGIEAVHQVTEQTTILIEGEAALKGLKASIPLSPGISQLCSLEEQQVIFDMVPAAKIGVKLTQSSMMVPLKSTSMIYGLGKDVPTKDTGSQCDYCSLKATCRNRKQVHPGYGHGQRRDRP